MKLARLALLTASLATFAVAGCAAQSDEAGDVELVDDEESELVSKTSESFTLRDQPGVPPSPFCDVVTRLEIRSYASGRRYASLRDELVPTSTCKIAVAPNARTYRLAAPKDDCGSKAYTGTRTVKGQKHSLTITDHRGRHCPTKIAAPIVTEETVPGFPGAITFTKYGTPDAVTILPSDATTITAFTPGGGFTPPAPPGSQCAWGKQDYSLALKTRKLTWETCESPDWKQPLKLVKGSRTLTAAEVDTVVAAAKELTVATENLCGADKPLMTVSIAAPSTGEKTYTDSFYSCMGAGRTYVDGVDGVFSAMSNLAH